MTTHSTAVNNTPASTAEVTTTGSLEPPTLTAEEYRAMNEQIEAQREAVTERNRFLQNWARLQVEEQEQKKLMAAYRRHQAGITNEDEFTINSPDTVKVGQKESRRVQALKPRAPETYKVDSRVNYDTWVRDCEKYFTQALTCSRQMKIS